MSKVTNINEYRRARRELHDTYKAPRERVYHVPKWLIDRIEKRLERERRFFTGIVCVFCWTVLLVKVFA